MKSKTKIIVLHMKEIIYTIIFAALGILLILLLILMFHPKSSQQNPIRNAALLKLTLLHKHSKNATCRVCTAKKPQSILSVAF